MAVLLMAVLLVSYSLGHAGSQSVIVVTPTPSLTACEPITTDIPTCINVGWPNTTFPNLRSHSTQAEAYQELEDFNPLIHVRCSNKIVHFLCAVYAPVCLYAEGSSEPLILGPCRSLCEYVRSDCQPQLEEVGYAWPSHFNCDDFPVDGACVDVANDIEIPPIPGLEIIEQPSPAMANSSSELLQTVTHYFPTIATSSIHSTPSPSVQPTIATSSICSTPSPSVQPMPCESFVDEGKCVERCNSEKYTVDNDRNIYPNPDYRVAWGNQCLKSCPEGYVEYESQCITSCPPSFFAFNGVCERCIGDCDEAAELGQSQTPIFTSGSSLNQAGLVAMGVVLAVTLKVMTFILI